MATTFAPTPNRGPALAREILDIIEAEERFRARKDLEDVSAVMAAGKNAWYQGSWAQLDMTLLPAGVEAEIVSPKIVAASRDYHGGQGTVLALSNGLTCGTAMCFAGHATHLVGDRMVMGVSDMWAETMPDGKSKGNLKRMLAKGRKKFSRSGWFGRGSSPITFSTDYVLVDERQRVERIAKRAQELLGLTASEANLMFGASNTLQTLRHYVDLMEQGRNIATERRMSSRVRELAVGR